MPKKKKKMESDATNESHNKEHTQSNIFFYYIFKQIVNIMPLRQQFSKYAPWCLYRGAVLP